MPYILLLKVFCSCAISCEYYLFVAAILLALCFFLANLLACMCVVDRVSSILRRSSACLRPREKREHKQTNDAKYQVG